MESTAGATYDVNASGNARVHAGNVYNLGEAAVLLISALMSAHNHEGPASHTLNAVIRWLHAPDPLGNHVAARKKHERGTMQWFLTSKTYRTWLSGDQPRPLWLHGMAGCCKTIMCSSVIEDVKQHIQAKPDVGLLYYYFSFSETRKQDYEGLLRSLLHQLCRNNAPVELRSAYDRNQRHPSVLEEVLIKLIQSLGTIYVAVDAIDECPETDQRRSDLLEGLMRLYEACPGLHLLMTSRREPDIEHLMTLWNQPIPLALDKNRINEDINIYIASELQTHRGLKTLPEKTKDEIKTTFAKKACGMFRWAACQLDEIKRLKLMRPSYVSAALRSMPSTLDGTYERMLLNVDKSCRRELRAALEWIAFADRDLSLTELVEACITNPDSDPYVDEDSRDAVEALPELVSSLITTYKAEYDEEYYGFDEIDENTPERSTVDEDSDAMDCSADGQVSDGKRQVAAACSGREETGIRLAHFSVKEFLLSTRAKEGPASYFWLEEGTAHIQLMRNCVAYIMWFSKTYPKPDDRWSFACRTNYPHEYWHVHQNRAEQLLGQAAAKGMHLDFLADFGARANWLKNSYRNRVEPDLVLASLLHCACALDLYETALALLNSGADPNERGRLDSHNEQAVQTLAYHGLDPRFHDQSVGGTALQAACSEGHERMVKLLLDRGADINIAGGWNGCALQAAIEHQHDDIVTVLLSRGADVNVQGGLCGTSLYAAARRPKNDLVERLLKLGADPNLPGLNGDSALGAACGSSYESTVTLLLANGADPSRGAPQYGSPLIAACANGRDRIAQLLLDHGADSSLQAGQYGSPMQAAVHSGSILLVGILFKHGASLDGVGGDFGSVLEQAVSNPSNGDQLIDLLLGLGANADVRGGPCGSPVQAAAYRGRLDFVQKFIRHGARMDMTGGCYGTVLQAVALGGDHEEVVKLLLLEGADPNARGSHQGELPLTIAAQYARQATTRLLLEHGARPDVTDKDGRTPLEIAARYGDLEMMRTVIQYADISVQSRPFAVFDNKEAAQFAVDQKIREVLFRDESNRGRHEETIWGVDLRLTDGEGKALFSPEAWMAFVDTKEARVYVPRISDKTATSD